MNDIPRVLITIGVIFICAGAVFYLSSKLPFIGKLPGDIFIKRDGYTFYAPIATSIIVSIVLTVIINLFQKK
jgi:ribose/xylose/arabinose/galactoside ABC-type transport system permease subunit